MKKLFSAFAVAALLSVSMVAAAAPKEVVSSSERLNTIYAEQQAKQGSAKVNVQEMPRVVVMYVNNAKTTYDGDIDQVMLSNLAKAIPLTTYQYVDGTPYLEKLSKVGIVDVVTAERTDIIDAFEGEDIDYAVFEQVNPFLRKDKFTLLSNGKEMTATVPFKIIDVKNNRYLYNGSFTELAKKTNGVGSFTVVSGNKSVALKAIETVAGKITSVIDVRLPKEKSGKVEAAPAK